jgi:DNA-binding transcriptional LysR family regulator
MVSNLPTELLRSFVTIVDGGSMTRAAERICVTQSALSLQMKRLSEIVGAPLFERRKRGLLLTPAGDALLVYARGMLDLNDRALAASRTAQVAEPLRIGMAQDFAVPLLSGALVQFLARNPDVRLQLRVDKSSVLNSQFSAGLLEVVMGLGDPRDPDMVRTAQMTWIGDPALARSVEVPLAIMEAPCLFRDAAIQALEAAGRPYRLVLETPSVAVLRAAVDSGLAITCRTAALLGARRTAFDLPGAPLADVGFIMRASGFLNPALLRLTGLIRGALAELEPGADP